MTYVSILLAIVVSIAEAVVRENANKAALIILSHFSSKSCNLCRRFFPFLLKDEACIGFWFIGFRTCWLATRLKSGSPSGYEKKKIPLWMCGMQSLLGTVSFPSISATILGI